MRDQLQRVDEAPEGKQVAEGEEDHQQTEQFDQDFEDLERDVEL